MLTSRNALILLLVLFIAMTASVVQAYPTVFGESGLILTPTADVMPFTHFDIAIDYERLSDPAFTAIPLRINYGIAYGAEISVIYNPTAKHGFSAYGANVKINLANEDKKIHLPAIALGARYFSRKEDDDTTVPPGEKTTKTIAVNATGSSTIHVVGDDVTGGYQIRAHAGVEYSRIDDGAVVSNFIVPFGGISYESFEGVTFAIDYLPALSDRGITFRESTLSGVVRFLVTDNASVEFGGSRPFGKGDYSLFAGVNYHYGEKAETPERAPTIMY